MGKKQIAMLEAALWKSVLTPVLNGQPALSGIHHFLPGRVSNIQPLQIVSRKFHRPVRRDFSHISYRHRNQ